MRWFAVAALFGCIYNSGGGRDGGVSTGGTGGSGGVPGCNPNTGSGCECRNAPCPVPSDVCTSFGQGGLFCSNACTQNDQSTTCALLPGAPGQGFCLLALNGGNAPDHCVVLCDAQRNCPSELIGQTIQGTCVCVGP